MSTRPEILMAQPKPEAACCGDDCCDGTKSVAARVDSSETLTPKTDVRGVVRERYGAIAQGQSCGCGCGCGPDDAEKILAQLGYTAEQAAALPEGANLGLGCGNPIAHAELKAGETVLDLGSGAGIDCFLAAREVGVAGHVIGVDMTPQMLERARANNAKYGANHVEFRLGEIEHLPVADGSVDAIISNCVVNLSPAKAQVFAEAYRVLKPGGRLLLSDLVLTRELSAAMQANVDLYIGCVAGASQKNEYLQLIRDAGFADVSIVAEDGYDVGTSALAEGSPERDAFAAVRSVKVRARKAAA